MYNSNVCFYVEPEDWEKTAIWLANLCVSLESSANFEEMFYFILDLIESTNGELLYGDAEPIAIMAKFYKATTSFDNETYH